MGRKKKIGKDPWDHFSLSEICLIWNAEVYGRPNLSVKSYMTEESFKSLRIVSEQNRRRRKVYAYLQSWTRPGAYFAFGTAKCLINDPVHAALSQKLGLFEPAKAIIERHTSRCPNSCCDMFHAGESVMPAEGFGGIERLPVIPAASSTSNYSLVSSSAEPSTAGLMNRIGSPAANASPSSLLSGDNDYIIIDSTTTSSSSAAGSLLPPHSAVFTTSTHDSIFDGSAAALLLQNGVFPSQQQHPQQSTKGTDENIYLNPGMMDFCSTRQGDLLVDDFVTSNPDLFRTERLQWMSISSSDLNRHFKFSRLLQHWAVQEGIHVNALTRFLGILHVFKPSSISYTDLPRDGRTLLKVPKAQAMSWKDVQQRKLLVPEMGSTIPTRHIGNYIHFGLEDALTGNSIGLVHRFHYITLLRRIHTVFPLLLPEEILELTKPGEEEPYNKALWANWLLQKTRQEISDTEQIVFEVKINVDGVQWFESSKVKGTPVLGKLIAIRTLSGKMRVKIPYNLAKPFVIGILEQKLEKPAAEVLMKDTLDELVRLQPKSLETGGAREGAPYAVEVACFCCDGPMRCELKGIKWLGYFSCERCRTKGVYLNKKGEEIVKKTKALTRKQQAEESRRLLQRKDFSAHITSSSSAAHPYQRELNANDKEHNFRKRRHTGDADNNGSPEQGTSSDEPAAAKKIRRMNPAAPSHYAAQWQKKHHHSKKKDSRHCLLANPLAVSHNIKQRALNNKKRRRFLPRRSTLAAQPTAVIRAMGSIRTSQMIPSQPLIASTSSSTHGLAHMAELTMRAALTASSSSIRSNKKTAGTATKKGRTSGGHRGSTYFPEVRALPRVDRRWEWYKFPEIRFNVSTEYFFIIHINYRFRRFYLDIQIEPTLSQHLH